MNTPKVYGAEWCHDTHRTRRHLDALGIKYDYIDIEDDPAAETWITQQNSGKRVTPTVVLKNKILFEPTDAQLDEALA